MTTIPDMHKQLTNDLLRASNVDAFCYIESYTPQTIQFLCPEISCTALLPASVYVCRYYTVGFQVNRFAVSILQYELLKRENSQWGSSRLAVEGKHFKCAHLSII